MPSAKHQTTLARQWDILRSLPSRPPGITNLEISRELEKRGHSVTKRTVERDMEQLSTLFQEIQCNDISKPYGWYWFRDSRIEFPGMDFTEAMSLGLLEDVMSKMLPTSLTKGMEPRFNQANQFLEQLTDNPNAHWSDLVKYEPGGFPLLPPTVEQSVFDIIQSSLLTKTQIEIQYQSPNSDTPSKSNLTPLALIFQGNRPYLIACKENYSPIPYAVQRIQSIKPTKTAATPPADFTLKSFLASGGSQFGDQQTITLKATLSEDLSNILKETPISTDQKITTRSGIHHLTASAIQSWQLEFWILSQGDRITIKQPLKLRNKIINQLQSALSNYQSK